MVEMTRNQQRTHASSKGSGKVIGQNNSPRGRVNSGSVAGGSDIEAQQQFTASGLVRMQKAEQGVPRLDETLKYEPYKQKLFELVEKNEEELRKVIEYKNNSLYFGQVDSNRKRHDTEGELTWFSSEGTVAAQYKGQFQEGEQKQGAITYRGGSRYDGGWKNGYWEGYGIYYRGDEAIYEGSFVNGFMSGDDFKILWPKAQVYYEGSVRNSKLNGSGKMTYMKDNTIIQGVWENDKLKRDEQHQLSLEVPDKAKPEQTRKVVATNLFDPETGQLIDPPRDQAAESDGLAGELKIDGCTYTGTWSKGKLNGKGKCVQADKGTYEGNFKDNERNAQGTYTWPKNQGQYTGPWLNGQRHGKNGVMLWKLANNEEVKFDGEWDHGEIVFGKLHRGGRVYDIDTRTNKQ